MISNRTGGRQRCGAIPLAGTKFKIENMVKVAEDVILVSISCITYNHAPYIRQCLDSFLMQKTNFAFEVLIHDDCSTDGTTEIIKEYEVKYPDIIKPIYEEENQYQQGKPIGSAVWNFPRARGKYIAMCEGDDYWVDPLKLQKQVDFMEHHPQHSVCFHAHFIEKKDGIREEVYRYSDYNELCPTKDVIFGGGGYMATNSMLFRSNIVTKDYPLWAIKAPVGDMPLMLILLNSGCVGYLNEIMSVYRINLSGSWSTSMAKDFKKLASHKNRIKEMWISFNRYSNYKYRFYVLQNILNNRWEFIKLVVKGWF